MNKGAKELEECAVLMRLLGFLFVSIKARRDSTKGYIDLCVSVNS